MKYFDLIFSLHSQDQMRRRGIKIEDAWNTFKNPAKTKKGKSNAVEYEKEFDNYKITVVTVKNIKNEWVVKSAWRNPPLQGTDDAKQKNEWKKYNKAGFWGKLWIEIKQQLGF